MGKVGRIHLRRITLPLVALIATLLSCGSLLAITQSVAPLYSSNRVIVNMRPGGTEADLAGLLAETGGRIARKLPLMNAYSIELPGTGKPADTLMARKAQLLTKYSGIGSIQYNYAYYPLATPNDQYYLVGKDPTDQTKLTGQWPLQPDPDTSTAHVSAPEAWDLQKGKNNIVVAVLDTGIRERDARDSAGKIIRRPHPDLTSRLLTGVDWADLDLDPSPSEVDPGASHGTHVAGIIAAQGNNQIGISGVCWDKVWILPIKVFGDLGFTYDDIIAQAISYCIDWTDTEHAVNGTPLKVNVINMSLGGAGRSDLMANTVKRAAQNGIVLVAASGNFWDLGPFPPSYPAAYDEVIGVGATDYADGITSFSQRGRALDLTAPGWEVLSTIWDKALVPATAPTDPLQWPDAYGNSFDYFSGTSMASPHVAGAAALLMSHGVPAADVRGILEQTATPRGEGRPNDTYGYGLVNLKGAVERASIDVAIQYPAKSGTVTSTKPTVRIDFRQADPATIEVTFDGQLLIGPESKTPLLGHLSDTPASTDPRDLTAEYYVTLDAAAGKAYLQFQLPNTLQARSVHTLAASAVTGMTFDVPPSTPLTDSDTASFLVQPKTLNPGWHLFSVPFQYDTPIAPGDALGREGLLARWNYSASSTGSYAIYTLDGSRTDAEATLNPPSVEENRLVYSISSPQTNGAPAGLGYWLYVSQSEGMSVPDTVGKQVANGPYVIGVYKGWNMVGAPFDAPANWAGVIVEYAGERVDVQEAVTRGWIGPFVYSYDNPSNSYTARAVRDAVMAPWEAQWVRVKVAGINGIPEPDLKFIISPSP